MAAVSIQSFLTRTTTPQQHVQPNVEISLQSGWLWATSLASFTERLLDFRSCWIVFIHIVRGFPGGLLQFSKGELLISTWHLFHLPHFSTFI